MKHFSPIDYVCIVILYFSRIFKNKKHLDVIYQRISTLIEERYLQTDTDKNDR